ncbi:DHH family phosphoesterase [Candidatus Uhrbacteria bacterium]|nr:DHH family phosphoesterase [Candidatus Uhrbacteria bacterium]
MEQLISQKIYSELMVARHPVFVCDERIDGDSLGAALAVADLLHGLGRDWPMIHVSGPIPEMYHHLPHLDICTDQNQVLANSEVDLIVVFDCSDGLYVERLLSHAPRSACVINIDHHKTNPLYGDIHLVDVEAAATAEVVYRFFEHNRVVPSREAATCLLTGMCFDTTAFSNSATNDRVLQTASELVLLGASIHDIVRSLYQNRSVPSLRLWGTALERLHFNSAFDCVMTCVTRKDMDEHGVDDEEIGGLSNFLSLTTDTDTLYFLRETEQGGVKVSMRSSVRDVSAVARENGGGGHERAAGYTIENAKLVCGDNGCWRVEKG